MIWLMKNKYPWLPAASVWAVAGMTLLLTGCGSPESETGNPLNIQVKEPVSRDFEAIKEDGILRMITRYSSNTYFLHRGAEWGFDYEFVKRFADEHDLALEVVITGADENPYDLLNS